MYEKKCVTLQKLPQVAAELIERFSGHRLFAFYGQMGAGKTTLIQAICRHLGSSDHVTSPTFAIVNEYNSSAGFPIFHFDFYRIRKLEEVYDLGYEDYFFGGNYCLVEWPEKIESLLPDDMVTVMIETESDQTRIIRAR